MKDVFIGNGTAGGKSETFPPPGQDLKPSARQDFSSRLTTSGPLFFDPPMRPHYGKGFFPATPPTPIVPTYEAGGSVLLDKLPDSLSEYDEMYGTKSFMSERDVRGTLNALNHRLGEAPPLPVLVKNGNPLFVPDDTRPDEQRHSPDYAKMAADIKSGTFFSPAGVPQSEVMTVNFGKHSPPNILGAYYDGDPRYPDSLDPVDVDFVERMGTFEEPTGPVLVHTYTFDHPVVVTNDDTFRVTYSAERGFGYELNGESISGTAAVRPLPAPARNALHFLPESSLPGSVWKEGTSEASKQAQAAFEGEMDRLVSGREDVGTLTDKDDAEEVVDEFRRATLYLIEQLARDFVSDGREARSRIDALLGEVYGLGEELVARTK